jgi:uncharacterized membrane protein
VGEQFGSRPATLAASPDWTAWVDRLALPAILALGLALRFYEIGSDSFWFDEGWSVRVAHLSPVDIVRQSVTADTHPPLYYLLLHGWIELFGDSESAVRSLSAVFGTLTIAVVYGLGRELSGRRLGLIAALFVATSEYHTLYAQEARMYTLLAFSSALSFLAFVRLREEYTPGRATLYVAATTLMLYSHVYGLLVLLAQGLVVALALVRTQRAVRAAGLRRWVAVEVAVLALYSPWLVALVRQTREEVRGEDANLGWIQTPGLRDLKVTFEGYIGTRPGVAAVAALVVVALVFTLRFARRSRQGGGALPRALRDAFGGSHAELLALWLLVPILVPFVLSYILFPLYVPRYTFAASLAFYLLLAFLVRRLPNSRAQLAAAAVIALLFAAGTIDGYGDLTEDRWRDAARYVDANALPGDLVLFDPDWTQENVFDYYSERADLAKRSGGGELASLPSRVWSVVVNLSHRPSTLPARLAALGYEETTSDTYDGEHMDIDLRLFERSGSGP